MQRKTALSLAFIALFTLACNLTLPQATPTIAPTRTPSQTPLVLPSGTPTATQTPTVVALMPSATQTQRTTASPAPSHTPSQTSTTTITPSLTARATGTSSNTPTWTPSATSTPSQTASVTASATGTASPTQRHSATFTPSATWTPIPTVVPTVTPLPTIGPTRTPSPTASPTLVPTAPPSPAPTLTPLIVPSTTHASFSPLGVRTTVPIEPTLDVPPTLVTAQPGEVAANITPPAQNVPTLTPLSLALTVFPTPLPLGAPTAQPPVAVNVPPAVAPGSVPNLAFTLTTAGGYSGSALQLPGGTTTLASDPRNPNHIALVDARGLLFIFSDFANGQGSRVDSSPFSFPEPATAETNQARVTQVAYASDSAWVAFLIDTDGDASGDNDSSNDGVYVLPVDPTSGQPIGGAVMLLRDCPPEPGCVIVNRPDAPYRYRSLNFAWSPSADALVVELDLPEEGRRGITIVSPAVGAATSATRPPVLRYDYGSWANDGVRLVISGRAPDGRVVVGTVNRDGSDPQVREVNSFGLSWVQSAVQQQNGQIIMLGSTLGSASPMRLYTADGIALTGEIGAAPPVRVRWSPDRSAVLVVTIENGLPEYYIAFVNGQIRRITAELGGALAVEWINR